MENVKNWIEREIHQVFSGSMRWIIDEAKREPTDQENLITGFLLIVFIVLWIYAGPQ